MFGTGLVSDRVRQRSPSSALAHVEGIALHLANSIRSAIEMLLKAEGQKTRLYLNVVIDGSLVDVRRGQTSCTRQAVRGVFDARSCDIRRGGAARAPLWIRSQPPGQFPNYHRFATEQKNKAMIGKTL